MKNNIYKTIVLTILVLITLFNAKRANAQRTYASSQQTGAGGLLCANCTVTNAGNAADGNLESYSVLNITLGLAAQTYESLIFASTQQAGTAVTVKLGTGNNLLSLTALGGITLQAYNGSQAIGSPVAANTLISLLSNNNQVEVSITPQQSYDRVRVTLNGGLAGALASIYLYDAFYTGSAAVACNTAIDELNGISSGLANVGGVTNPQNAIDGNINTASTLSVALGLVGTTAQQTIIYASPSVIGDSVRLTLSVPNSLLSAGVFQNISVSTFNGNTSNNDATAINSSLISLQLLGLTSNNDQIFTVTVVPKSVFDRVQLTLGGIVGVLSSLNFYEAQRLIPSPVIKAGGVATNNPQVCSGSGVILTATAVPNTVFNWYTAATGGTPFLTGATFTTPALTSNTVYYVAAMRGGCTDESERTKVTVTVNAIPVAPVVTTNNINVCSGQTATFAAQSVTGVTVNWYSAATGGTLLYTGNSFTTGPITQTTSYYAEAVAGGTCVSTSRTQVTATVAPAPAAPALTASNVTICTGNVAVLAVSSPQTGITYNWYSTSTGGIPLNTGTSFTTPLLSSNTNYYVEASNATGCTSTQRTQATVTVIQNPADPTLSANNSTINAGQTATITVSNAQTGTTYNWFTSATSGTPVFTGATYTTPALYTNTTYYINGVNSTGCTSTDRTPVSISVVINNNSPCTFANQQSSTVNGLCIGCSISNAALATDADTTTASNLSVVAGLTGANVSQQLIFQQAGFAGDTIRLELQNPGGLLSASVLGQIQVTVLNGSTQVATYALNSSLLKLGLLAGTSSKYAVYIPATGAYDRISVSLNSGILSGLTSLNIYDAIQIFAKPVFNPAAPEVCNGSTAQINITSPANGTFNWYTTPTGGASVNTGTSFTTPVLTANTTYYVEYSRGGCIGPVRFPVQVTVDGIPAAPVITTQNVTINNGQTATLSATASNNATVQWFTSATGGTAVATGNTFTTPALTNTTTYYAGAATGSCVSATRTPVTVTVLPVVIPSITVTPPTVAVSPGQTATFTASSTTAGAVFNWYTTPTGGTSIYTGATYTTPAEFAGTTYYAEATVPATGAVSASRATGTVTINQLGISPVACDAAIDQTNTTSGVLCVGCSINNTGGAVDNDRNTFSQLSVPIGLVNAYASQTLRFANTGLAGDSVIIELGIPGSLVSAGVLSQIAVATYNGATYNNDRFNVNGSLINISLLSGTNLFKVAFKAQSSFDRVEIRLNAALAGVFNVLNVYDATEEVAAPVVSTTPVTACQGSQATLTATATADATIKWYTTASGGSPVFTGATFTTPVLTNTTTYYAEASRSVDGCTQTVRTPATVNVVPIPTAPVVSNATATVCSGQPATFSVNTVSGVTYNWFTSPTGGTSVFTGSSFTTPALAATTSYYVEAESSGQCSSSTRTQVTANVTATPSSAVVTSSTTQTCSGSSAVLTASSVQPGVTFNWYTAATGGTPVFTGANFTTPTLSANTSYYVEVSNGNCVSPARTEADVTVNPLPATPTITVTPAGGQVTSGQTAQLSASSTTANVTFNWYTTATGGTPVFTGANFTTPALTSNTTYYVEAVSNTTGCVSIQRSAINITVNQTFSTSCDFASSQAADLNGGLACLLCAVNSQSNSVDNDTTNYSTLSLPVSVSGYVGQKLIFGDSGSAGDTVTIKIGIPVSLATVGVLNQIQVASYSGVGGATSNGDLTNFSSSAIKIQVLSGGQTAIIKFVPAAAYDAVEVRINSTLSLINSLNVYYATKEVPVPQLTAKTVNICAGSQATFIVSNPIADVTYKWYTAATGGASVNTGTTFTTSALTATTIYYVESSRTSNGCANPNRIAVNANVTPAPVAPVLAQNAVQICSGDQVTLSVTNANGATVNWYNAATGGNLLFTGATFQASPISTTAYYAETTNGTCASSSRTVATVTVNPRPAAPGVQSANVSVCSGSSAVLQVLNPASGVNYQWFTALTGGAPIFTNATFTTTAITQNTNYYVQAVDATSGCSNNGARTQVAVTVVNQIAAPTLSATSTQVCNGGSATISVINPVNGMLYNWYTAATGGTPVFTGTVFTANNLTANASYFVEAANSSGCTSSARTETDIAVQQAPAAPQIQANSGSLSVCLGSSASLSIVNPQPTQVYNWYDAATNGNLLYTGSQFNTPVLTANTTYYVKAAQTGNCNSSAATAVTVTINALPADPVLASASIQVCSGSSATFTISSPQTGVTYQWFDSPAQTNKLSSGTTFVSSPITVNTTFYVAAVNASGCQSSNLLTARATIQAPPSAPAIANGDTVQICTGSIAALSIAGQQTGFTYNWYTTATGGAPLSTGTSFTTPMLSATTTYYAEAVNTTGCTSSARTPVIINVNTLLSVSQITLANAQICPGDVDVITVNNINATINWYTTATGGTPVFTGKSFTTPALNTTTTYYAEAVNNSGCTSATRAAAVVNVAAPLAAPVVMVPLTTTKSVTFSWNAVSGATGYEVSVNNATAISNGTNLTYTVTGIEPAQSVTIMVKASGSLGCQLSAYSTAVTGTATNPLGNEIYVPNAFTPNGDGKNDIFQVYGNTIKNVNMWIYDQWGNMLYSSKGQSVGWDGTYKGKAQPDGVYVYYVEATLSDGQMVKKKGTLDLLR